MTTDAEIDAAAARVLRANDGGGWTAPAAGLYPFQWNWDSALTALGWRRIDEDRAFRELATLLAAQWPDGMVPQIVFHRPDPRYFPGPEVWRTGRTPPTSGITQPPVLASCLRRLVTTARDRTAAVAAARRLLPAVARWHRWFHDHRRDPSTGLLVTVHPWETGMDNAPAWDGPLARVPVPPDLVPRRCDLQAVPADQRPRDEDYRRYLALVLRFRALGWDQRRMAAESPFRVADPATHLLLLAAERDLAALARSCGGADPEAAEARAARLETAIRRWLVDPATGFVHAFDLVAGRRIPVRTAAAFLVFRAGLGDPRLEAALDAWTAAAPFPLPTVHPDDPAFEPRRYWRGPMWPVLDRLVGWGLAGARAERLRRAVRDAIRRHGFREYHDPRDGTGLGGCDFSWTAAVWLDWITGESPSPPAASALE